MTASAQSVRARLIVTVTDPSGGVIPKATVTLTRSGSSGASDEAVAVHADTTDHGVATLANLAPGRYDIRAEFEGFDPRILKDVRLRAGDNRHVLVLPLPRLETSVTVRVDPQIEAADRNFTFGTALTREQIDALSDDPDEMRRQLQEMVGGDAIIRVDSFEGGALPLKAQIKAIHITRDAFAAENHSAGGLFIDIITQPGLGPLRGNLNARLRDSSLNAGSPFATTKPSERTQTYFANLGGTLVKDKSSFSIGFTGNDAFTTPILRAALPDGTISATLGRRVPSRFYNINGLVDYALSPDQTLRLNFFHAHTSNENQGIGAYDLPERAFSSRNTNSMFRLQEAGPLGRRFFMNARLQVGWSDSGSASAVEVPTIRVIEAFTRGGQQVAGGRHSRSMNLASDIDYVRGRHSWRGGVLVDAGWSRSDDRSNYLGTYTFESLDAYLAGTPRSYTRRIGDPNVHYSSVNYAVYIQDDVRVRRSLTLSPGVRYEGVSYVSDGRGVAPRFGITWSPFKTGATSLRASTGIFYDWVSPTVYEQTLRVDGFRQRELNIADPFFDPVTLDPGDIGFTPPTNRYLFANGLRNATYKRVSAGIDQRITRRIRVNANYAYMRGSHISRGRDLNAPVEGIRPDPEFSNVVETVSDASAVQHIFAVSANINLNRMSGGGSGGGPVILNGTVIAPPPPPPGSGTLRRPTNAWFDWRRLSLNANYVSFRDRNNSDGAFALPASGSVQGEWGPSSGSAHHRLNVGFTSQQVRNLLANISCNASSAPPLDIRTGRDDNGDLVFNDRPVGVSRNSGRAGGQRTWNGTFIYSIPFGKAPSAAGPGAVGVMAQGGAIMVASVPSVARYRLTLNLNVQNLTNHANYGGYSGVMTSRFFGQPTMVINPRKVDFSVGLNF